MKIPLIGPSYVHRSLPFSSQRSINLFMDMAQAEARDSGVLLGTPGLEQWIDVGGTVGCRGAIYQDSRLYAVIGTTLYIILADGTYTNAGTIGGDDRLSMAINGVQVCIVSQQAGAFIYSLGGGLQQITDVDFTPSAKVVFLDQYFVHLKQSSQVFFLSAIADGTSYDALDFASAEASPDLLRSIESDNGEIWLFGETTSEVWTNTGAADFPFSRIQGAVLQKGIAARDTVARMDNTVYWLGNDGVVYRAAGYQPQAISTNAIDTQIARLTWTDAYALTYSQEGHNFFALTFPTDGYTFVYDASTNQWHERSSRVSASDGEWRVSHIVEAFGRLIAFDRFSGKVGYIDMDTYHEYDGDIIRTRISPVLHGSTAPVTMPRLEIVMETGVGTGETTPEPIICYYALNASAASLIAEGYDGRLSLSGTNQTGTYTVQSGLVAAESYAMAQLSSAIALNSGTKAFEWNYILPTIIGGAGADAISVTAGAFPNPFSATPIARFEVIAHDDGTFTLSIFNGATKVYTNSATASGLITMIFDATAQAFAVKVNGTLIILSNNVYTAQDALLLASITEEAGVNVLFQNETASVSLVSNASSLTYAQGNATPPAQGAPYILDASAAEIISVGGDGRPVMSNGDKTGTRTVSMADASAFTAYYAAPNGIATSTAQEIDATAGTITVEGTLNVPDFTGVELCTVSSSIYLFPVSSFSPLIRVGKLRSFSGSHTIVVSLNGVSVGSVAGSADSEDVSIVLDCDAGTFRCFVGVTEITLSNDVFTPQPLIGSLGVNFDFADPTEYLGKSASATFTYDPVITPTAVDTSSVTDVCAQSVANPPTSLEADTSDGNPILLLSHSDDGGRTFSNDREGSMGRMGEYLTRMRFHRLGRFYQRVLRLRVSAGVKVAIIAADAEIEVGRA